MLIATYAAALTFTATPSLFIAATTVTSEPKTAALRPETVLFNKVTIYGLLDSLDVAKLTKIVNKYLKV